MAETPPTRRPPIVALTGVRFFAAFYVVLYHFRATMFGLVPATRRLDGFLEGGFLSVDFFFVLSGYIIAWNYLERMNRFDRRAYRAFLRSRLARIYPLHAAILALLAIFAFGSELFGNTLDQKFYAPRDLVEHLLLVSSWRAEPRLTWNYPAWSISAEWLAYLLFPFGALLVQKFRPESVFLATLISAVAICFARSFLGIHSDLARLAAAFPLGVALAALQLKPPAHHVVPRRRRRGPQAAGAAVGLLCLASFPEAGPVVLACRDAAFLLLTVLLVALLAGMDRSSRAVTILGSRPILYLGSASYSLYLVHAPVLVLFQRIVPAGRHSTAFGGLLIVVLAATTFGAAHLGYRYIEEPARRALTKPRREPSPGLGATSSMIPATFPAISDTTSLGADRAATPSLRARETEHVTNN